MNSRDTRSINVDFRGLKRELRYSLLPDGTAIPFLPLLGDTELITHAATEICRMVTFEAILCADTVGLVMGYATARESGRPWVAARKKRTPQMSDPLITQVQSIASMSPSTLYLDRKDATVLHGRVVLLIDEVTSTGSTLEGLSRLADQAGAASLVRAVLATEGLQRDDVVSLAHLPVIRKKD